MDETLNHEVGLQCFAKTSGSKGLQIYVLLNTVTTYEKTKRAPTGSRRMEREHPEHAVSGIEKHFAKGRCSLMRVRMTNKTTVNAYSRRAKLQPSVSPPVTWREVESTVKEVSALLEFSSDAALNRVERRGDLFAPLPTL
jgi:bifunctional non-homologous end joining protein LigD